MIYRMVRYGVMFAFILQSFLLLWCAGRVPAAREAMGGTQSCATESSTLEAVCCCESEDDSPPASLGAAQADGRDLHPVVANLPERCCQCPLTANAPRAPAVPDRRSGVELTQLPIVLGSATDFLLPASSKLPIASAPVSSPPPAFAGRLACERFCRWTI